MNPVDEIRAKNPAVTQNQALFIHHLRTNPNGHKQVRGVLENEAGMCAIGLGMEAFGIARTLDQWYRDNPYTNPPASVTNNYAYLAGELGITVAEVDCLYVLNDSEGLSFIEVANHFEKWLRTDREDDPYEYWKIKGSKPGALKKDFIKQWNKLQKEYARITAVMKTLGEYEDSFDIEDLEDLDAEQAWGSQI